ncbi:hypothetical protein [Halovivax sp.]|uniref:hypothetical protein n=1 Tax=Halovivax sp. TaxID=1935978 RepID=UPI0025C1F94A|nr:hypothetical protein [Halovivax sp.]
MATSDESNGGTIGSVEDTSAGEPESNDGATAEDATAAESTTGATGEPAAATGASTGEPAAADGSLSGNGPESHENGRFGRRVRRSRSALGGALGVVGTVLGAATAAPVSGASLDRSRTVRQRVLEEREAEAWDAIRSAVDGRVTICGSTQATDGRRCFWLGEVAGVDGRASARSIPHDEFDVARALAPVDDGGAVVVGNSSPRRTGATSDVLAVRTEADGRTRSRTVFGESGYAYCNAVIRTRDGGYLIGGGAIPDGGSEMDAWIAKTDAELGRTWSRTYGRSDGDTVNAIAEAPDGGVLLVGSTAGGHNDVWLVKVDDRGRREWDRTIGGDGYDLARAAIATRDGGYAFAGHTTSGADGKRAWIATLDAAGELSWERTYRDGERSLAHDLVETDRGFAVAGESTGADGGARAFVATVDRVGTWRQKRTFDRAASARSILTVDDGRYVVVGTTRAGGPRGSAHPWIASVAPATGRPEPTGAS